MENRMNELIDLSHTVEDGMITYKGLPAPLICDFLSREASKELYNDGTTFQIGKIEMVANTGTYLDAPFHRFENGKDLSQLDLESLAHLIGIVVHIASDVKSIDASFFQQCDISLRDKAVLVCTGWSCHWRTDQYFENHPYLTECAATYLRDSGVSLVGIDSHNIDDVADHARPVHTTLLGADIPIVEHLCNLAALPESNFRFYAVPVKVAGFGTFPVRAFALLGQ